MPCTKKMGESMRKLGISEGIIAQFDCFGNQKGNPPEPTIAFIDLMDRLLTKEQCLAVMEKQGCCKGGKRDKDCKAFGKAHAQKPLAEKIALLSGVEYMMVPRLDDDETITLTWGGHQNGVHTGKTTCSCGAIKKLKQPFLVSPTYCGCCAGHFLHHYQNALGVKLRLKEIVSSPLNTNGDKPCSFTYEILKTKK